MIISPITVAVELLWAPDTAMIPDSVSIVQKAGTFEGRSPWTGSRWSRRCPTSVGGRHLPSFCPDQLQGLIFCG